MGKMKSTVTEVDAVSFQHGFDAAMDMLNAQRGVRPRGENDPYAYAYVKENGVGTLSFNQLNLPDWKEIPLYAGEPT